MPAPLVRDSARVRDVKVDEMRVSLFCGVFLSVYDTLGNGGRLCLSRSPICRVNETQSCDRFLSSEIFARVRLPAPVAVAATLVAIATAPMIQATARTFG